VCVWVWEGSGVDEWVSGSAGVRVGAREGGNERDEDESMLGMGASSTRAGNGAVMTRGGRATAGQIRRLEQEENGVGREVGGVSRSRSIRVGGWSLEVGGSRIVVRGRSWRSEARGRGGGWEAGARRLACISPAGNWPANYHIRPLDDELHPPDNPTLRRRLRPKWPAT
jgi:hypothetical protein